MIALRVVKKDLLHQSAQTQYGAVSAVRSFPPIENRAARVLVLGSMPGAASLLAGWYYAYPHNAFWPIMGELLGAGPTISYGKRVLILKRAGLALWDVMASCVREGSLDADIDEASIVPNDFHAFFDAHPRMKHVFFNGAKAENCFHRFARPHVSDRGLHFTRLPSTSPAHASLSLPQKLKAWRAVADAFPENSRSSDSSVVNAFRLAAGDAGRGLGQNGAMLNVRFKPESSGAGRLLLAIATACVCTVALSADQTGFSGKVVVELLDGIEFAHKLRLLDDIAFTDAGGKVWLARKGGILDGESVPRELYSMGGLPYLAEYRKAAVVHDYFCRVRTEPWRPVHRMFYHASVVEGASETQAKALYAVVYAGGWRWEPNGSSCYLSCHAAAASLAWKPAVMPAEVQPVLQWIAQNGPTLDEIDARLDAVIRKPGPHLFAQGY